jgi:hypothetical protein
MLPRLVQRKELVAVSHEGRLVYAARKHCTGGHFLDLVDHGLGCTEGMVRFWRADTTGRILPERQFKGIGSVPEWAIIYGHSMLLFEFCTRDNVNRRKVESKVLQYRANLPALESRFDRRVVVVFVMDVERPEVRAIALKTSEEPCYFVDYATFKSVAIGEQLTAPIYLWSDGEPYALRNGKEDI